MIDVNRVTIKKEDHIIKTGTYILEISTDFVQKLTYMYELLQFSVEMNTRAGKSQTTCIPFHSNYDLQGQSFY